MATSQPAAETPTTTPATPVPAAPASDAAASTAAAAVPSPPVGENASAAVSPVVSGPRSGFAIAFDHVMRLVGKEAAIKFRRAVQMSVLCLAVEAEKGLSAEDADRLEEATGMFVELLSAVPEDKQEGMGFAELLLAYGQALLVYVRKSGASAGVLGDAVEKKEGGSEGASKEDAGEEDIEEEEEDYEELAWTQLETARVLIEKVVKEHGGDENGQRLGAVHTALGDLLLEGDSWDGAGREFETAARLLKGRLRAEALYKRYLALRREAAREALQSLKESIVVFEGEKQDEHTKRTLQEMKEELKGFEEAVMGAVNRLNAEENQGNGEKKDGQGSGSGGGAEKVVVVQPRKRARRE
eukprot:GFKZ01001634.1.p1 GENE.GFKZ01001634.1~~GFKZ01001634.1.p1  ORF type:complete len:356 (-),score=112.48 GFKZ01001634.1:342-1409(-)